MSSPGSPTLILELPATRSERGCALLFIVLAACVPVLLMRNLVPALAAAGAVSIMLGASFRVAGWLGGPQGLVRATWRSDGIWRLTFVDGTEREARLLVTSRMSPLVIWLRWSLDEPPPRTRTLLLLPRDVAAADFRRLLVRLRLDRSECAPI